MALVYFFTNVSWMLDFYHYQHHYIDPGGLKHQNLHRPQTARARGKGLEYAGPPAPTAPGICSELVLPPPLTAVVAVTAMLASSVAAVAVGGMPSKIPRLEQTEQR